MLGSSIITTTNINDDDSSEQFTYSVINNVIHENSKPMKFYGSKWIENQDSYDIDIQMICSSNNLTFFESDDTDLRDHTYDLNITVNIQSNLDQDFEASYKAYNRIFAINAFSQLVRI